MTDSLRCIQGPGKLGFSSHTRIAFLRHSMSTTVRIETSTLLDRFATGQALRGQLARAFVDEAGAGAVLPDGARVGPWTIVELLGSGGMSHVYLASRHDDDFDQHVALKVVRGNANLMHRLRHERALIASLRHPHIVNLIDSGETDAGELWLAMGLVEGQAIDRYAALELLDWRARLQVFDAVCAAVEYAHGRGLIHRDIKPANVLIDTEGHPRLLDFGIAIEQREQTAPVQALTPGFAAPEQISGQPLTTATDIYQLGLLLQRVLSAGHEDPKTPKSVRADFDALIARATATEPLDRHSTVAALRADLKAIVERRPLAHLSGSRRMRWARFIERNRLPLFVSSVAGVVLLLSLTLAALELRRERDHALANEARARAIADFLIDTLSKANPWRSEASESTVVEAMDRAAERLDTELEQSLDVRRELRLAIASVYQATDQFDDCLKLLSAPAANNERAVATATQRAELLIVQASCHFANDQTDEAWALLDEVERQLEGQTSATAERLRAELLVERGEISYLKGKIRESNDYMNAVLAMGSSADRREQSYSAYRQLAFNTWATQDFATAANHFKRALALAEALYGPSHRNTLTTTGGYAMVLERTGKAAQAEALLRQAITTAEGIQASGAEPQLAVAVLRDNLATILFQQVRLDECQHEARAALAVYQREAPESTRGYNPAWRIASCAYMQGKFDVAAVHASMALKFADKGIPVGVINAQRLLAAVAARRGEHALAQDYLARADAAIAGTAMANSDVQTALFLAHALAAAKRGDHAEATTRLRATDTRIQGKTPPQWLSQERNDVAAMVAAMAK